MSMLGLFEGPAPRVRNAPPSAAFLDLLRDRMIAELKNPDDPFALADALVLVNNRRAGRVLQQSFAARESAALLPAIRPLGDLDDDADVWGPDPASFDAPPAIDPLRRRLELAALLRKRVQVEGGVDDPVLALATADELCKLLDGAAIAENVDWSLLPGLVGEKDLAAHWLRSARFLEIITQYWPQRLGDELMDRRARNTRLLNALADQWTKEPPQTPIIIAGSTGSVPAVRRLMKVVASLPRGVVVLPGLESDLDDAAWKGITPQHPQFALRETVNEIGLDRREVVTLAGCEENERAAARRALLREALAPADITADWLSRLEHAAKPFGDRFAAAATQDLTLCEAASEDEEASIAALALRGSLEEPGRTAALVTSDPRLAARVAAKLKRWDIHADLSAGTPLSATAPGLLLTLLAALAGDDGDPVALAALAQHPLSATNGTPGARALIDIYLRGARKYRDLATIGRTPHKRAADAQPAIAAIANALTPLKTLLGVGDVTLDAFANALVESAELICAPVSPWQGRAGDEANKFLRALVDSGNALGPIAQLPRLLTALMSSNSVPPDGDDDPRIAIWGPLEARLQRRDVIVLGGLNEGQWPAPPPDDPFLSRPLRDKLGLPPLDAQIGLAAHDFAQLANAPRVVLTRSTRVDGAPSVASRWVWRLLAVARAAGADLQPIAGEDLAAWARALDAPRIVAPAPRPNPKPAAKDLRIASLSVTDVEHLVRDPYAIFAKRILGLTRKDSIGLRPGPAERGSAAHDALEKFQKLAEANASPEALLDCLDDALAAAGFAPERRAGDRARLEPAARAFVEWNAARRGVERHLEIDAKLDLGGATLTGRADRIDIKNGRADIIDYKTGAPPTDKMIQAGFAAQLLLEAAILEAGAFVDAPAATAEELIYWRFAANNFGPRIINAGADSVEAGRTALAELKKRLAHYADPRHGFVSQIKPQHVTDEGDYDHLARRAEWEDFGAGE